MSTEPKPNLHHRILAIMQEVPYVQKVQRKTGLQYTFVNRDGIVPKLRAAMIKHGVTYYPNVTEHRREGTCTYATVEHTYANADNPQEFIRFSTFGYGVDSQDKGPGKAMTYAEKAAHLKAFMIEAGDEDEAEHYDEDSAPSVADKPKAAAKAGRKADNIVQPTIDEARAKFGAVAKQIGLTTEQMTAQFQGDIRKAEPAQIVKFVNEMEKRWSAKEEFFAAVRRFTPSADWLTDKYLGVNLKSDLTTKNWFEVDSKTLEALTESIFHSYDLPFGNKEVAQ